MDEDVVVQQLVGDARDFIRFQIVVRKYLMMEEHEHGSVRDAARGSDIEAATAVQEDAGRDDGKGIQKGK